MVKINKLLRAVYDLTAQEAKDKLAIIAASVDGLAHCVSAGAVHPRDGTSHAIQWCVSALETWRDMVGADYLTLAQVPAQTFMQGLAEEIARFLSMEVRLRSSLESGDAAIAINGQRFRLVMIHLSWLLRRWLPCSEIVMHISDAESPPTPGHLCAGTGSRRSLEIEVFARSNAIIAWHLVPERLRHLAGSRAYANRLDVGLREVGDAIAGCGGIVQLRGAENGAFRMSILLPAME
ncbi:hypothetical protein [Cupriavidus malaysiensis]|uniref:Uncharacterized protein n=1 Tax=Cupriavidus malaysiensis TaxID=367825 RepID=A0ABN4TJX4_9BURK|nr:hypothetical protein [Cupriavidus malaysiensis]AOZ06534.1 hypothetical protein BKK80_12415 [Cupriavidus malaysiensis]